MSQDWNSNKGMDKTLMLSLNTIGSVVSDNSFKSFDFRSLTRYLICSN